jgi:SAM-dependent methyltransferase
VASYEAAAQVEREELAMAEEAYRFACRACEDTQAAEAVLAEQRYETAWREAGDYRHKTIHSNVASEWEQMRAIALEEAKRRLQIVDEKFEAAMERIRQEFDAAVVKARSMCRDDVLRAGERKHDKFQAQARQLSVSTHQCSESCRAARLSCDATVAAAEAAFKAQVSTARRTAKREYLEETPRLEFVELGRSGQQTALASGVSDGLRLPFADHSVDKVLAVNSLHFWPDLPAALRELRRVLRPRGKLICTTKLAAARQGVECGQLPPCVVWREADIYQAFREAGFSAAIKQRFSTAQNHSCVRASCAHQAASERAALLESQRKIAADAGVAGLPCERIRETAFTAELSECMLRCRACRVDLHPITDSVWHLVFVGPRVDLRTRAAMSAVENSGNAGTLPHGQPKAGSGGNGASTMHRDRLVLCARCHSMKCTFAREIRELELRSAAGEPDRAIGAICPANPHMYACFVLLCRYRKRLMCVAVQGFGRSMH